jgi:NAD(P)-dependent dehydrogenase (short-subunit alcohol dehydrogenase family)
MTTTGLTDRFAGRTALVTGAGGGIGSAISRRLAEESAHVFVADANDAAAKEVATCAGPHCPT